MVKLPRRRTELKTMWLGLGGKSGKARLRKRRTERFSSDLLTCPLGSIVDLSATGLRLRCDGKPTLKTGQCLPITLQSPQSRLTLRGRVVWIRKRGFRAKSFDLGVEFIDMHPNLGRALEGLAQFGFIPRMEGFQGTGPATAPARSEPGPQHYEVLGLTPSATSEEIHVAYRAMARQYHPDVNKSADAAARFDAISKAYRVLRDPALREGYDLRRGAGV